MGKHLIIFVGRGSGKISDYFLNKLVSYKTDDFDVYSFKKFSTFTDFLTGRTCAVGEKIFIFPVYCEDNNLKRQFKIDLAKNVEEFCQKYTNCTIFHGSKLGEILGDKYNTNVFLTSRGVRCPKIISDVHYGGKVFVNARSASHAETKILDSGLTINPLDYNTEFIDTSFEYRGDRFYACPRTMCIQGIITDVFMRFRNANERNPNVHGGDTPMDPDLHNFYYETKILPNLDKLNKFCHATGEALGFGFYGHDLLLCNKTNEFYMAESSFKFDNIIMWKNFIKDILPFIKHEKSIEDSTNDAAKIFYDNMKKNFCDSKNYIDISEKNNINLNESKTNTLMESNTLEINSKNENLPIKIFVGSEIGNEKAEKALHWSIINTSTVPVEINWMDDRYEGSVWEGWNKGRDSRDQNTGVGWKTNFSCFRWAIPELCGFKGKAIYLDVDQIVLKDIKQMWELPLKNYAALAIRPERTDVMLIDCEKFSGDWWRRIDKMKPSGRTQGKYRLKVHAKYGIGPLDVIYNCLDGHGWDPEKTRLVHYTRMSTQPWRPFPNNMQYARHNVPELEILWHEYYANALEFEMANGIKLGPPRVYGSAPTIYKNVTSKVADFQKK